MDKKEKNKRKFLMLLPVLIIAVCALLFLAFKGNSENESASELTIAKGINTTLPDAKFDKDAPQDKLSLYELTEGDSSDLNALMSSKIAQNENKSNVEHLTANPTDPNEQRINQKLEEINHQLNQPPNSNNKKNPGSNLKQLESQPMKNDVDRLEKLMKSMQEGKGSDPEMEQLGTMLDKIMIIQNPSLAKPQPITQKSVNEKDSSFKAIPASIDGYQKVKQGGVVKIKLLDTIRIKGILIPKNHSLYGLCSIVNQRLLLDIDNIRLGNAIIPVDLTVFSLDGMVGINAPEAELGEAASSGVNSAIQDMQFLSVDQSLGVQAAGAGITAAKGLFGKKIKKVRVKLKAGQAILLRNNQISQR